jgi:hypothetical protein
VPGQFPYITSVSPLTWRTRLMQLTGPGGGLPPDQIFGSSNDFDLRFYRNSINTFDVIENGIIVNDGLRTVLLSAQTTGAAPFDVEYEFIPNGTNAVITSTIAARQNAGSSGAVGDGAGFVFYTTIEKTADVLTVLDDVNVYTYQIDAGITVTISANGAAIRYTLQGVANRNLDWTIQMSATHTVLPP